MNLAPLAAIAQSTRREVLRQPLFAIVALGTIAAVGISPSIALFGLGEDLSLLGDFGASTLLLSGLILASFGVSLVVGREIECRTALVLLSKPVGRATFLSGKLAGVLAAVSEMHYMATLVLLLAARVGPPQSTHDPADWPAVGCGLGAFFLGSGIGAARSWRRGTPLGHEVLNASIWTFTAAFLIVGCFDPAWRLRPFLSGYDPLLARAAVLAYLGAVVLGAVAVLISVIAPRGALLGTILVFCGGLAAGGDESLPALGLLPDLQAYWVGEALYVPERSIPLGYLALAAAYSAAYATACVAAAAWLLERREVG